MSDNIIEHEAWNESDELRVLPVRDVWSPSLSLAGQTAIAAVAVTRGRFTAEQSGDST